MHASKFLFLFLKVENILSDFSFFSPNWGKGIQLSLSPLKIREIVFKFLFLFLKLGKLNSDFSFSSRNGRNCFQISLSLLELTFLPLVNHCTAPHPRRRYDSTQSAVQNTTQHVAAVKYYSIGAKCSCCAT